MNNFYASVEQVLNPDLNGKFIAVSGNPAARSGVILAKNTAAKQCGVKTGEVIWQAKQKCPQLVCVPPHFDAYVHYSKRVRQIYEQYTDKVEGFGLDECWLDVTHSKIFGTPFQIAERLRSEVRQKTGLTISVGVSFTKTFAKLGSDMKKPDAITVITRENFKDVVWPLDVSEMLYVGPRVKKKLNSIGIFNLGDLANANPTVLTQIFGIVGERMQACALGQDTEEVTECAAEREIKSVSHGTTTLRDMVNYHDAEIVISVLSEMVATRLRRYGYSGSVVHLDVRRNDLSHESKQQTVRPTIVAKDIYQTAVRLLRAVWRGESDTPLRSLTVSVGNLAPVAYGVQASLFDDRDEKQQQLEFSVDQIRHKYGFGAITKAGTLANDLVDKGMSSEEDLLPFKR
ncbi:MAG: hypothetical protein NC183_06110 [Corallococcus sp.]|nr:hypothetical protein [Corallococcus sp.]MCM1360075.1 hypothetical protein [Corallococcus sp.]